MASLRMFREHRFARSRISAYVDGELSPGDRQRVERHAADCPDCGPLLRGLTSVRAMLARLGRRRDDEVSIVPVVIDRVRAEPETRPLEHRR